MLAAYLDESGNSELFTLSCVVAEYSAWLWFEFDWKECIDKKNVQLERERRRPLSRYHAADCSSRVNEFSDWTADEQVAFFGELLGVFRKHITNTIAYTINLNEFVQEIPESANDPKRPAYALLLKYLMIEIGKNILARENWQLVTMIHDRSQYDGIMKESFGAMVNDPTFRHASRFFSIAPMSWEHCIPLQPADLVAYENFKEVERQPDIRKRRRSLEALLGLGSTFGGRCVYIPREGIREIKVMLDAAKAKHPKSSTP